jgi:hypothetical protein
LKTAIKHKKIKLLEEKKNSFKIHRLGWPDIFLQKPGHFIKKFLEKPGFYTKFKI